MVEPLERRQCGDRRRPGPGHDPRRRPAAGALDQRRDRDRAATRARRTRRSRSASTRRARARSRSTTRPRTARRRHRRDYTAGTGTLTFAAGQTVQAGDGAGQRRPARRGERDLLRQPVRVPSNATIADGQGLGTITDDDPLAGAVRSTTSRSRRGTAGRPSATYTVSLNAPSGRAVSVDFATADGTATAPADYLAASGTLNFAAGQTIQSRSRCSSTATCSTRRTRRSASTSRTRSNATIADGQGVGHDHRRRRAARAVDRRRDRRRGRLRDRQPRPSPSRLTRAERPTSHRRLRDRERDGTGARRLPGRDRHAHVRRRPEHPAR